MDWTCGRSVRHPAVADVVQLADDPFERAEESEDYPRWRVDNAWAFMPAQAIVAQFLQSFKEFPPRAKPGSFSLDQALEKMRAPSNN